MAGLNLIAEGLDKALAVGLEDLLYPYLVQDVEEELIADVFNLAQLGPLDDAGIHDVLLERFLDYHVLGDLPEQGLQVVLLVEVALNEEEGPLALELALVLHDLELVGPAHDSVLEEDVGQDVLEHL
ncbi:MAG: hypothetical protein ACMG6E_03765 [Candidatus Roizmanbacteria bacterium]